MSCDVVRAIFGVDDVERSGGISHSSRISTLTRRAAAAAANSRARRSERSALIRPCPAKLVGETGLQVKVEREHKWTETFVNAFFEGQYAITKFT